MNAKCLLHNINVRTPIIYNGFKAYAKEIPGYSGNDNVDIHSMDEKV